jgi:hypothetical protein
MLFYLMLLCGTITLIGNAVKGEIDLWVFSYIFAVIGWMIADRK